jgi:hypothetical protein
MRGNEGRRDPAAAAGAGGDVRAVGRRVVLPVGRATSGMIQRIENYLMDCVKSDGRVRRTLALLALTAGGLLALASARSRRSRRSPPSTWWSG